MSNWLGRMLAAPAGSSMVLLSIAVGVFSGLGPLGLIAAVSVLFFLLVYLAPLSGTLLTIAAKPLIDCFWDRKAALPIGTEVNLQSLIGIVVPVAVILACLNRRWRFRVDLLGIGIMVYVIVLVFGVAISPRKGAALVDVLKMVSPFTLYWLARSSASRTPQPLLVATALAAYGIIPVLSALMEIAGVILPRPDAQPPVDGITRVSGFYYHPLDISTRCNVALAFSLYLARALPMSGVRQLAAGLGVLMAVVAYMTWARSALVATSIEVISWIWMRKKRIGAAIVALLIVGMGAAVGPVRHVVSTAVSPILEGSAYQIGTGRALVFTAQIAAFRDASMGQKLFGRGIGSLQAVIVEYSPLPSTILQEQLEFGQGVGPHNQLLRVLGESGLIGLLVFLLIWVCVAVRLKSLLREASDPAIKGFAQSVTALVLVVAIYAMSLTPLDSPSVSWPLWFAIGYLFGLGDPMRKLTTMRAHVDAA
jgi:hypothetical protein